MTREPNEMEKRAFDAAWAEVERQSPGYCQRDTGTYGEVTIDGSINLDAVLRAAIQAMREPYPEMAEAAIRTFVRENGGIEHAPYMTWRAMIDAASPPETKP